MSLDLYIISEEPVQHRGTGVFIREGGRNLELKTIEEVREHFPDSDISHIREYVYEDDKLWHGNITHNLTQMADHVPLGNITLYDLLWEPDEHSFNEVTTEYATLVFKGLVYVKANREELEQYNPPIHPETGTRWGDYDIFLAFCQSLATCLIGLDYNDKRYTIEASR